MKLKGNVEFLKVDSIFDLPFENETFDVVVSESVFSYIKNKEEVLKELNRVTKKNGCIGINEDIILEEMPDELYQKFDRIFYPLFKFEIIKLLTLPQWLNIFKRCGINNVEYSVNKLPSFSPLDGFVEVLYFPFVVKTWLKIIYLSTINAELRKRFLLFADIFDKELKKEYLRYHGFCIFVGKKT
ncbi:MAG: hypothetical protein DRN24_07235 [Thermoplasmata archaeon]|nr:MAG: hypothetical protein DRN24_07235 [Thermoplasmata archaeon]